jgi:hypothetical protein
MLPMMFDVVVYAFDAPNMRTHVILNKFVPFF